MVSIGTLNRLRVVKHALQGAYLDGGDLGEILLPRRYVTSKVEIGEEVEVFIYRDSEDRLVATTERPVAMVGDFACLKIIGVSRDIGAFLDWGLSKDLLLPFREQTVQPQVGHRVVVYVYLDPKTARIVASARLRRHVLKTPPTYKQGQQVNVMIVNKTPLGYNALIEREHMGILFVNESSGKFYIGQELKAFVRAVHQSGKIDLGLDASGYERVAPLTDKIMESLKQNGGWLPFSDDSSPESIREKFGVSKKAFKQAIGNLYKSRKIQFVDKGIEMVGDTTSLS